MQVDICEKQEISKACQNMDYVFLSTNINPSNMSKEQYEKKIYQINTEGVENTIQAAIAHNVKKIVFISSVSAIGMEPGIDIYDESFCKIPDEAYGRSKLAAEKILLNTYQKGIIDISILRPSAIYGKDDLGLLTKIVYFIDKGIVPMMGNGENLQSVTYIDNVVNASIALMENNRSSGSIYIISDRTPYTVNELVQAVGKEIGKNYRTIHFPVFLLRCAGNAFDFFGKISGRNLPYSREGVESIVSSRAFRVDKIQKELNFSIEHNLESGLRNTFLEKP